MKKEQVKLSELKMDNNLLSIRKINPVFVSRYRQNYRAGAIFPLLIVEEGTNRIISGNHRHSAMLQEFGKDYEITVILRKYKNEKEVLIDFANENSRHGNPLDGFSKKLLIHELLSRGVPETEISKIFNISIQKIEKLGAGMVSVIIGGKKGKSETIEKPAKRGFEPPRKISQQEYTDHKRSDRGLTIGQKVMELSRWLENDLIIYNNQNIEYIESLKSVCEKWLEKVTEKV